MENIVINIIELTSKELKQHLKSSIYFFCTKKDDKYSRLNNINN